MRFAEQTPSLAAPGLGERRVRPNSLPRTIRTAGGRPSLGRSSLADYLRERDWTAVSGVVHGAHTELKVVLGDVERHAGHVADVR